MIVREQKDTPFEGKDLILTQNAEAEKHVGKTTYLTHAIPVKNVIDFINRNKKYLKTEEGGEVLTFNPKGNGDNVETKLKILDRCEKVSEFDAEFLEINDEMADKCFETELVYSIVVNRYVSSFFSDLKWKQHHFLKTICFTTLHAGPKTDLLSFSRGAIPTGIF